ncbi:MAG TPA: ATP synthase F1 subunit delta [Vicinamibacterales bacterium]|jgi:F-type H+-transporting ATPase subunit delta|nr:ATP synthase F1 subunit delta [Vicinamibacterales bacterium]
MTNRTAGNRYARALLEVAIKEQSDLEQIGGQLAELVELFTQNPMLSKVMLNPAVPVPRKRAAMIELTGRANLSPIVSKLLVLLAERDRLVLLADLLAAYRERLLDHQNVVRAEITTAAPLAADRAQAIERGLAQLTGRTIRLASHVDPSIIGGVVARLGDTVYDGSVTRQLAKIREKLVAGV